MPAFHAGGGPETGIPVGVALYEKSKVTIHAMNPFVFKISASKVFVLTLIFTVFCNITVHIASYGLIMAI